MTAGMPEMTWRKRSCTSHTKSAVSEGRILPRGLPGHCAVLPVVHMCVVPVLQLVAKRCRAKQGCFTPAHALLSFRSNVQRSCQPCSRSKWLHTRNAVLQELGKMLHDCIAHSINHLFFASTTAPAQASA